MPENSTPKLPVDRAVAILGEDLRVTLALLHRADDGLTELIIATLPHGSKSLLKAMGAITGPDSEPVVTGFGRELITACELAGLPPDLKEKMSALDEKQAQQIAEMHGRDPLTTAGGQ